MHGFCTTQEHENSYMAAKGDYDAALHKYESPLQALESEVRHSDCYCVPVLCCLPSLLLSIHLAIAKRWLPVFVVACILTYTAF